MKYNINEILYIIFFNDIGTEHVFKLYKFSIIETDLQNFWNINSYDNSFLPEKSAIYGQCSNDEIAQATQ